MTLTTQAKLTIDEVKAKFQQWRDTRKNSKEKIPESLWAEVLRLVGSCPAYEITRALGLNHTQLKTKLNEVAQTELSKIGLSNPFIEVGNNSKTAPIDKAPSPPCTAELVLLDHAGPVEIKRSDGSVLIIQALPINSIYSLIQAFIG